MTNFFAHVSKNDMLICGISAQENWEPHIQNILIEQQTALDFLSGAEAITDWYAYQKDGFFGISKIEKTKFITSRLELSSLQNVNKLLGGTDICLIMMDTGIKLHYNKFRLKELTKIQGPLKLYFTDESDISDLLFTVDLSEEGLKKLFGSSEPSNWKPSNWRDIIINLPRSKISIYTNNNAYRFEKIIKSDALISIVPGITGCKVKQNELTINIDSALFKKTISKKPLRINFSDKFDVTATLTTVVLKENELFSSTNENLWESEIKLNINGLKYEDTLITLTT